jgi:hypothetical protein
MPCVVFTLNWYEARWVMSSEAWIRSQAAAGQSAQIKGLLRRLLEQGCQEQEWIAVKGFHLIHTWLSDAIQSPVPACQDDP